MPLRFLAIIVTALATIAPGAHLLELPHKLELAKDSYFIVQRIYTRWWIAGLLLPLALLANIVQAFIAGDHAVGRFLALGASVCLLVNLVIFVVVTRPANAVTQNWTVQSDNWEALRRQWEYSHAVNAGVSFAAFCLATIAALTEQRGSAKKSRLCRRGDLALTSRTRLSGGAG